MRRLRLGTIVLLAAALAATGCTGGDDTPSSAPGPAAGSASPPTGADRLNLGDVCPSTIVVQTDWFPETEYAVYYHLLGPDPKVDTKNGIVTPIFAAQKTPVKPGVTVSHLVTNEFIDPSVGVR